MVDLVRTHAARFDRALDIFLVLFVAMILSRIVWPMLGRLI